MSKANHLLFFLKYPEPGKCKTRLAQSIGDKRAIKLYKQLVELNFAVLEALPGEDCEISICFGPPGKQAEVEHWIHETQKVHFALEREDLHGKNPLPTPIRCHLVPQCEGDLGLRLEHAFKEAFAGGAKRVMALGSDSINLTVDILLQGFKMLKTQDVVLGPSLDGGYYLVGTSKFHPELFKNVPWSTHEVLGVTFQILKKNRLSYQKLPELNDLDEVEDLDEMLKDLFLEEALKFSY